MTGFAPPLPAELPLDGLEKARQSLMALISHVAGISVDAAEVECGAAVDGLLLASRQLTDQALVASLTSAIVRELRQESK